MKRIIAKLVSSALGIALITGVGFAVAENNSDAKPTYAIGSYSTDSATYYNGITATSGKQLAAQLHDLITSTHMYYTSYDDNGKNLYQQNTDQYYENGSKVNGYIYEFYSGVKWPNAWAATAGNTSGGYNREHCWCQSNSVNNSGKQMWGENGGGADMHHLRPVEVRLNSTRSNNVYGEISNRSSDDRVYAKYGSNATYAVGGYLNSGTFEPLDSKKGDVARIIFYTYLHYNSYTISDIFGSYGTTNGDSKYSSYFSTSLLSLTKTTNQNTEAKALEMLLKWNTDDPVDDIEIRRNNQVAVYQGNRNPFIDNSSYADAIWGTTGITSISKTSASLTTGSTTTISAIASNGGTISWTTSNSNICAVSSGTASSGSSITLTAGNVTGTATITASVTISGTTYSKTCTVTVSTPKVLSSIAVSGAKTSYTVGDSFVSPTVTATYGDSSTADVTLSSTFTGYNLSTTGNQTVTVSYTEGSTTKTTTYNITVSEASGGESGSFDETYDYGTQGTGSGKTWTLSDCEDKGSYWLCPESGTTSVALIPGIFTDKTITSSVVITINSGTYGSGTNPSSSTFAIFNSEAHTTQVTASQTGTLPTSKTYTDVIYTVSLANASSFSDDLAILITKPGKQIRLVQITVEFDYETSSGSTSPTLTSITLDTTNVQTEFILNEEFNYDGLLVVAHYSDDSSEDLDSFDVSTPDMSTTGNKTITVTYGEQSETYTITVSNPEPAIRWNAPTIDVYSGTTLTSSDTSSWNVEYASDGTHYQTISNFIVKLGGSAISLPYTWNGSDDAKTLCVEYNSLSTETVTVTVTQTLQAVMAPVEGEPTTSTLTFEEKYATGGATSDRGEKWTVTSDGTESNYDSTKGIHYGTGSAAVQYINLISSDFTSGKITKVVVNASTASGVTATVAVNVGGSAFGGDAQSLSSSAAEYTFNGEADADEIEVIVTKPSSATKALYCKSIAVTYAESSGTQNIANDASHKAAQRVAVKFANAFNNAMATTQGCTTNLNSAWSTCSTAYNTFNTEAAALGSTEEAYAKNLVKYATAQYSEVSTNNDCLERMMKTYEIMVGRGKTAFMSDLVSLGRAINTNPLAISNDGDILVIILIISIASLIAIGGYFYLRKKHQ